MKRHKIQLTLILTVCLLFCGVFLNSKNVDAASQYKEIYGSSADKSTLKSGKYYFKYNSSNQSIYMSRNKYSGFQKTPIPYHFFSNGKQSYYIRDNVLYKYDYFSKKEKKIKKIKVSGDQYYDISTIYGKNIFITKSSFDEWKLDTYCYNMSTKKYKKVKSGCDIIDRDGKYALARQDYQSDVSAHPLILYKINNNGLRKLKTLSRYSLECAIIKGKIYYTSYTNANMEKGSLYRCNIDGTKSKKLVTAQSSNGQLMFMDITDKYCVILKEWKYYKYTYSTKKFERMETYK